MNNAALSIFEANSKIVSFSKFLKWNWYVNGKYIFKAFDGECQVAQ